MTSLRLLRAAARPAAIAALTAMIAPPVRAQTIPSPYRSIETRHEVGAFGGLLGDDRGALGLAPSGGPMLGGRYGINLTGPLSLEGSLFFILADREVYDPFGADGVELLGTEDAYLGGFEARARFAITGHRTWNGLQPYVLAGAGVVGDFKGDSDLETDLASGETFDTGPTALVSLGAGSRWLLSGRLGLKLEAVLQLRRTKTPAAFLLLENELGPIEEREWVGGVGIVGGFTLGF